AGDGPAAGVGEGGPAAGGVKGWIAGRFGRPPGEKR
ncbi:MAG: hypothetical protein JWO31_650, partial [Phycisphaerales bacterium]|nr:hypothetical protein [Phycisphaerales bacterium]